MQTLKTRPALFLSGSRQTGKSSLLRKLFPKHQYVSLDYPADAAEAEENPDAFLKSKLIGEGVILDEIQYAPSLTRRLKILIDENRHENGRFLLTSSQIFESIRGLSESLAGRISIRHLMPLSQHEVAAAGLQPDLIRGFYPELVANPAIDANDFFRSYVSTYLERDLRSLLSVKDLRNFDRLIRALSTRVGSLMNAADIGRDVGVTGPTVSHWISILRETGILLLVEPYFDNRDKRWTKSPKIYFNDTGLLCHFLKIKDDEDLREHSMGDKVWENFVMTEFAKRLPLLHPKAEGFYLRDAQAREVDLLVDLGSEKHLIEIKHKEMPNEKDAENLRRLQDQLGVPARKVSLSIACLTPEPSALPGIRLFNPLRNSLADWLS